MSFLNVYTALYDQVKASSDLTYVDQSQFLKGFKENYPQTEYSIIFEPGNETDTDGTSDQDVEREMEYIIDIYARVILVGYDNEDTLIGNTINSKKGVLEVIDDIKTSIRADFHLGYSRSGSSVSAANAGTSFSLTSSNKFITVNINNYGAQRSGYEEIFCGDSTLSGDDVATNIQASLRAIGVHADDGYINAVCTFDGDTKQFTISTDRYGPKQTVVVTAGDSNDCSALLGYDSPIELTGRNITSVKFGIAAPNNIHYPVRYRILPVMVSEEISI